MQISICQWRVRCREPDEWRTSVWGTCSISQDKSHSKLPLNQIFCDSTFCRVFSLSLFSPGSFAINSEFFSVFTLCCFHYANTKLVAGLMFFLYFFLDRKWDWGSSPALLWLAFMRNWFLEISSITGQLACVTENYRDSQFCPKGKESLTFIFSPTESRCNV